MNRTMKLQLTPHCIIISKLKDMCGAHYLHHGELHQTTKIKIINR